MGHDQLDPITHEAIEKATWRLLKEAGITSPPVYVPGLVKHLDLYRDFYDLQTPSFLDQIEHKSKIYGRRLIRMVKSIRLVAVLLFDENRILLDTSLPEIKHDWPTCHEVGHRVLRWHKTYFRGDTAQTLHPEWHERLEAEANYAASELMFCGPVFGQEARDVFPRWDDFMGLRDRYGKSMAATLRRFVTHGPDRCMAMMVSTPSWEEKPEDQPNRWRHFVGSRRFAALFSNLLPEQLLSEVDAHARRRRGGPVAEFMCSLDDGNGEPHEFCVESFYNRHDILTLFVEIGRLPARKIIVPTSVAL